MNPELHVVFGAGQVGFPLAARLLADGTRVRIVKRSSGHVPAGSEMSLGDAADPTFCIEAARGASVVYHCMNPPYDARVWAEMVPRYMDNLIAASARAGARLVVLDNVYMLGRPRGRAPNEDAPMNPCSRKGEIRARAAERLFAAPREATNLGARLRFLWPRRGAHTARRFLLASRAVRQNRVLTVSPRCDSHLSLHSGRGGRLATLGCAERDVYGRPWMLPCAPAGTLRELVVRLATTLDRDIRVRQVPRAIVRTVALFVPLFRELAEMLYQWDEPFIIDDRRFRERFHVSPTDPDHATAETVAWARQHYGRRASSRL